MSKSKWISSDTKPKTGVVRCPSCKTVIHYILLQGLKYTYCSNCGTMIKVR